MNIYVTNLSSSIIDADLFMLFSAYGKVGFAVIIRDIRNGRSKGVAFVEMPIHAQARQAVLALHNMKIDGFEIAVREIEYKLGEFNN